MFTVEISNLSEMLGKFLLTVDECVTVGKEAPTQGLILTGDAVKQVLLHLLEVSDDFFGNREVCSAVSCRLEVLKSAHLQDIGEP